jgi:curved DNA-binding protein CbpA
VSSPDPYKVLQVDPEAGREVIEAAYKRLARMYHPDVSGDPDTVARMVQINQAWEALRDPARRAGVDRARARVDATSARVVAADGKAHAATARHPAPAHAPAPRSDRAPEPPFPGVTDPSTSRFEPPTRSAGEPAAASWTSGRSDTGYRYDTRTMGMGAAGAPPGNPSGSIVTFGRYEGWTLGEIARRDLEYLEWLDRMPIGRTHQSEIDALLRQHGRRTRAPGTETRSRGLFRRR